MKIEIIIPRVKFLKNDLLDLNTDLKNSKQVSTIEAKETHNKLQELYTLMEQCQQIITQIKN